MVKWIIKRKVIRVDKINYSLVGSILFFGLLMLLNFILYFLK